MRAHLTSPTLAMTAHVTGVVDLCPTLRRITLGGDELRWFGVDGPTLDLRFKLVLPTDGGTHAGVRDALAVIRPDAPPAQEDWYRSWLARPESSRGVMRTYTAREVRHTRAGTELVVDVVLHTEERDGRLTGGPATLWAATAAPGQPVMVLGPNRSLCGADYGGIEWRPQEARHVLLVADETAVPAVAAILEHLQGTGGEWTGHALLEVPGQADQVPLTAPRGITVEWLPRDGAPRGARLAGAVADAAPPAHRFSGPAPDDVDVDQAILWETSQASRTARYAWMAGEAGMLKQLRRYLLGPAGYSRDEVAIMGYWREGRPG